jgi:hypothetical protein
MERPEITVEARAAGQRAPLMTRVRVPLALPEDGGGLCLRDVLVQVVRQEVQASRGWQEERLLLRVLTPNHIWQAAGGSKVVARGAGQVPLAGDLDEVATVVIALKAFVDGLYVVFLDGMQREDLDAKVFPTPENTLTIIRLVALAGAEAGTTAVCA